MVYMQLLWVESRDKEYLDGGATEADGRLSTLVGTSIQLHHCVGSHKVAAKEYINTEKSQD